MVHQDYSHKTGYVSHPFFGYYVIIDIIYLTSFRIRIINIIRIINQFLQVVVQSIELDKLA